jgi:hypothetical protein
MHKPNRLVGVFVINISPPNWRPCRDKFLFGIREGGSSEELSKGDICLVRVTGADYGVKAIWAFTRDEKVGPDTMVPWTDARYISLLYFEPLVAEFANPFSEEFTGVSKYSQKVGISAARIIGSIVRLRHEEIQSYLRPLLREKHDECDVTANYRDTETNVKKLLEGILAEEKKTPEPVKHSLRQEPHAIDYLVGDPLNFRGIVYSPLNEAGVVLLFSRVMDDMGIFYEGSPSSSFPDMIARERTSKGLERRYIEFEFKASNFKMHKHPEKMKEGYPCDLIVCWENDWPDSPIKIISLKDVISNLT